MFVTYKVVNLINGDFYIGSHKTNNLDDKYMGSGKLIKESIAQYGIENHKKEIIEIFDNREDSLKLEHDLIKYHKDIDDPHLLNMSFGGQSFDYINENLVLDKAAFGRMAKHCKYRHLNEQKYMGNPNTCLFCGIVLDYNRHNNKFCSSSCAASYNNALRKGYKQETRKCLWCGKEFTVERCDPKKYCNNSCSSKHMFANNLVKKSVRPLTPVQKFLLDNLDNIKHLREIGHSYNTIAKYLSNLFGTEIPEPTLSYNYRKMLQN